jgi:pimeloyl-ACP methyl ester carboxylesterase
LADRVTGAVNGTDSDAHAFYVGAPPTNAGVIIFVHGLFGDDTATWTNTQTKAYWPYLVRTDNAFMGYDVYVYGFPSPFGDNSYTIDQLSDVMRVIFNNAGVSEHNDLIFLAHSMGGLVTRAFLLKNNAFMEKTSFVYFFSTPTTGSDLANVAQLISDNPQTRDTSRIADNAYLGSQQSTWLSDKNRPLSFCAYELLDTNGFRVVSLQSATNLCTEPLVPLRENHISVVKPAGRNSLPYIAFRDAFNKTHRRAVYN